jgi:putative hydrolase
MGGAAPCPSQGGDYHEGMSQQPFGDIPLFRELQKLLSSGEGPINLEIARQVAGSIAVQDAPRTPPDEKLSSVFSEAVRSSEQTVSGYTGLQRDEPMMTRTIDRTGYANETLDAWKWLLVKLFGHYSEQMASLMGAEQEGAGASMKTVIEQIGPLMFGLQAGTLVGQVARDASARYDPPIPRDDDGRVFLVEDVVQGIATDYSLDLHDFVRFLALHEGVRHLILTTSPWTTRYFRSLLIESIEATEIDVSDMERRLMDLQTQGQEALQEGFSVEQLLPIVPTERHRRAVDRLKSFMAALDGYAAHATDQVGERILGPSEKLEESIARRNAAPNDGRRMLTALLGLSFDKSMSAAGTTFCAAIVKLRGIRSLNSMWEAPDNLPTLEEIRDPFTWMERVLPEEP